MGVRVWGEGPGWRGAIRLAGLGWFALVLLCVPRASAQVTVVLSGTVTDASGAAIAGAGIAAVSQETGAVRNTVTDNSGHYQILALPVGQYRMTVTKPGFREVVQNGIQVVVGQEARVDFTLSVGEVRQQVQVSGEIPLVSVTTQDISGLVGERQVKNLPLNGRSYDRLLTLNPGVVNYTWEKTGGVGISNSAVGNMFSVAGNRPQQNLFLLNGVEFTGAAEINMQPGGTSGELLGVDAVREFNVLRHTYGAEYGKRPGAQVNIVTQSGTNRWHGNVFEFARNGALDAPNYFDHGVTPPFTRNQFGGGVGGPLRKGGTFLFASYEGFRQRLGLSDVTLVPDQAARDGSLVPLGSGPCNCPDAVRALLDLFPAPNGPELGNGIAESFSHPVQTIREDFGNLRLDQTFSPRDSFSTVYTVDDSADVTPTSNPFSTDLESLREQVWSLEETHVFSPATINVARFGFSRAGYFYTGEPTPGTPAAAVPGFVAGRPVGAVVIGGSAGPNVASQISLAGSNIGSNLRIARNLFTYEDHVSLVRGRQQWSMGVWFQRLESNENLSLTQYGQANFADLTHFLEGSVATFQADPTPTPLGWRSWMGAWYVQDVIRLNPRLTLSLGFRDEFTDGWNEAHGRAANYVFDSRGVIETQPRVAHSVFTVNRARFLPQPRIGVAWSPFDHTVVRAGFGIYNDLQDALGYRLDQNAPFNPTYSIPSLLLSQLPITPGAPLPGNAKISPAGVQPDLYTPTVESYSLKVEWELAPDLSLSLGYVGSHGYHEIVSIDANQPVPTCLEPPCTSPITAATAYYPLQPDGSKPPLANPELANTWSWFSEGSSSYNALVVDVNRRFSHGFAFRGVYTWSKTLDNGDSLNGSAAANAPGLVMFPADLHADWGPATFDVRQVAVINGTYALPFGPGKAILGGGGFASRIAAGWTLHSILTVQSGFPFTPQMSFNPSNNGDTHNPVRPSVNPAFTGPVILGSPTRYFNPDAFVVPPNGTYGNLGRNTLVGPGLATWDLSAMKEMPLGEGLVLQLRAEFFNVLNRANFNTPNLIVFTPAGTSPAAGVITGTSTTSRQIQLGVKLQW